MSRRRARARRRADPERFAFVRDGFYFWAFLLGAAVDAAGTGCGWCCSSICVAIVALIDRGCGALGVVRTAVQFAVGVADRAAGRLRGRHAAALDAGAPPLDAIAASWSATICEAAERRFFDCLGPRGAPAQPRRAARATAIARRRTAASPDVIGLFPEPERRDERRDRRLRLGQSALGRQGVRARGARERTRSADRGDARSRRGARAPIASCCRASAPSPIAGAASMRCPAWSRRWTRRCAARAGRSSASASACSCMAERGREYEVTDGLGWIRRRGRPIAPSDPALKIPHMGWNTLNAAHAAPAARRHPARAGRACTPISCTPISSSRRTAPIWSRRPTTAGRSPRWSRATAWSARNSIRKRAKNLGLR